MLHRSKTDFMKMKEEWIMSSALGYTCNTDKVHQKHSGRSIRKHRKEKQGAVVLSLLISGFFADPQIIVDFCKKCLNRSSHSSERIFFSNFYLLFWHKVSSSSLFSFLCLFLCLGRIHVSCVCLHACAFVNTSADKQVTISSQCFSFYF